MTRLLAAVLLLPLLASCARSEDASVIADSNESIPAIERPEREGSDEEEIAVGEWRPTTQEDLAALEFGAVGTPPVFSMRCADGRGLLLQRHDGAPSGDLPTMVVSVGDTSRRLAVTATGGTVPMLRASLPGGDALIATIAGAAVPIVIRIGNAPPLVLPAGPAVSSFVGRCTATDTDASATNADTNATAPTETNEAQPATTNSAR